jgi:Icc protein
VSDIIKENLNPDGIDRRGFLKCMAWAGTGTLCVMQGGVLKSFAFSGMNKHDAESIAKGDFAFAQISDSHIGFNKAANPDVTATLREAIAKLNALPQSPEFVLHTGDLTQLSKADEFDALDQSLKSVRTERSSTYQASTTCSTTMARNTASATARIRSAMGGTALTIRASTS